MTKGFGILLLFAIFVGALAVAMLGENGVLPYRANGERNYSISTDAVTVRVELADTKEKRVRGLSGRDPLAPNAGMLFVFDEFGKPGIWMKDMKFPIDILWLSEEGVVVDIVRDARPESYPTVFRPDSSARYVLEVNAGFSEIYNIGAGTRFDLSGIE